MLCKRRVCGTCSPAKFFIKQSCPLSHASRTHDATTGSVPCRICPSTVHLHGGTSFTVVQLVATDSSRRSAVPGILKLPRVYCLLQFQIPPCFLLPRSQPIPPAPKHCNWYEICIGSTQLPPSVRVLRHLSNLVAHRC